MKLKPANDSTRLTALSSGLGLIATLGISACTPPVCEDPDGCEPPVLENIVITTNIATGNYDDPQSISISAPDATAVYISADNTWPDASRCNEYTGETIDLRASTIIKVTAIGDGENFRNTQAQFRFVIDKPSKTEARLLNTALQLEQDIFQLIYDYNNDGNDLFPEIALVPLAESVQWYAPCPGGGEYIAGFYDNYNSTIFSPDFRFLESYETPYCEINGYGLHAGYTIDYRARDRNSGSYSKWSWAGFSSETEEFFYNQIAKANVTTQGVTVSNLPGQPAFTASCTSTEANSNCGETPVSPTGVFDVEFYYGSGATANDIFMIDPALLHYCSE